MKLMEEIVEEIYTLFSSNKKFLNEISRLLEINAVGRPEN